MNTFDFRDKLNKDRESFSRNLIYDYLDFSDITKNGFIINLGTDYHSIFRGSRPFKDLFDSFNTNNEIYPGHIFVEPETKEPFTLGCIYGVDGIGNDNMCTFPIIFMIYFNYKYNKFDIVVPTKDSGLTNISWNGRKAKPLSSTNMNFLNAMVNVAELFDWCFDWIKRMPKTKTSTINANPYEYGRIELTGGVLRNTSSEDLKKLIKDEVDKNTKDKVFVKDADGKWKWAYPLKKDTSVIFTKKEKTFNMWKTIKKCIIYWLAILGFIWILQSRIINPYGDVIIGWYDSLAEYISDRATSVEEHAIKWNMYSPERKRAIWDKLCVKCRTKLISIIEDQNGELKKLKEFEEKLK